MTVRRWVARGAVVWLIACLATAGCARDEREPSDGGPASYPSPLTSALVAKLVARFPSTVGKNSFGSGVDVNIVRPAVLFSEARIVDGTLYVMYYPLESSQQKISALSQGVLHPVSLAREYWAMSFRNDNRVILATASGGVRDWYELLNGVALPVREPASPVYGIPHHVLIDGDSCADGLNDSPSAIDDIRNHERVSILSDAAMLRATGGLLRKGIGVYCDHFHGNNYVTMDRPGLIFRIDGSSVTLISQGWIEAAGDRHMLLETQTRLVDVDAR
jgi:hypothetical protein